MIAGMSMAPVKTPTPEAREVRGQQALRSANRAMLIAALREGRPASRAELARLTGLSGTTVSSVIADLVADGIAAETDDPDRARERSGRGRPGRLVQLVPSRGLVLGLDLTYEDGIRGVVGDLAGTVLAEHHVSTSAPPLDPAAAPAAEQVTSDIRALVAALLTPSEIAAARLQHVVVGVRGAVDPGTGRIVSVREPWWGSYDAAEAVANAVAAVLPQQTDQNRPVVVTENDANLITLGEAAHGAARGLSDIVCLDASSGIGAGLLLDGRLYRGWRGGAGEIGHVEVEESGSLCTCGNRGCLETVASLDRVLDDVRGVHPDARTAADLAALVAAGDRAAVRAISDAGALIGKVLADVCNVLAPQAVVVGGSLAAGGPAFSAAVHVAVQRNTKPRTAGEVLVLDHELGDRAVVLGALAAALEAAAAL